MVNNILDYIDKNVTNINAFQQDGVEWINHFAKTLNSEESNNNPDFLKAVRIIKESLPKTDQKLYRKNVKDLYSDIYTGFIATLFWGHIFPVHLKTIIATPKQDIESQLSKLINGLKKKESFDIVFRKLLKGGDYHIDGIGVSFFTKVLNFTSHIHKHKNLLILDGKMWDAYNAFLKAYGEDVRKYKVISCKYEDYERYCDFMQKNLSVKNPEQLEAFLFTHNNEVKLFLSQGNEHAVKDAKSKIPRKIKRNKKENENEWKAYKPFNTFNGSMGGMEFIKPGYCLPLRNKVGGVEHYRVFVAKHTGKEFNGLYFCEIMKGWRDEKGIIDENPDAFSIFYEYTPSHKLYNKIRFKSEQAWYNSKNNKPDAKIYRYLTFDETVSEKDASAFMEDIVSYVKNTLDVN